MKTRTVLATLGLVCLLSASLVALETDGAPSAPASAAASSQRVDWWMFGHDPQHSRRSSFIGPSMPTVKWTFALGGTGGYSASWTPLSQAADGTLYVGADHLYALNPDGTVKWEFDCGPVWSTPAIGEDGTLYFGSDDHQFYALNADGHPVWPLDTGQEIRSSPAIGPDGTVYACLGGGLRALSPDGDEKWRFDAGEFTLSSPTISHSGSIYFAGTDFNHDVSTLHALEPTGELLWEYRLDDHAKSPVVGPDGSVYINGQRLLTAVNLKGELRWQREINSVNYTDPAVGTDGTIYVGGGEKLQALSPGGDILWDAPIPDAGGVYSCPAIGADGTIYIGGGFNNTIYAFRPDGSLLWEYKAGGCVNCAPLIGPDGTLYVADWNRTLFAFGEG